MSEISGVFCASAVMGRPVLAVEMAIDQTMLSSDDDVGDDVKEVTLNNPLELRFDPDRGAPSDRVARTSQLASRRADWMFAVSPGSALRAEGPDDVEVDYWLAVQMSEVSMSSTGVMPRRVTLDEGTRCLVTRSLSSLREATAPQMDGG